MDSVAMMLIILYGLVVFMGIVLSLMVFTGWWRGGPTYGHQEERSRPLVRWWGQAAPQEAEETKEVI